ncbi:MAG TPA: hypothetical protein VF937_08030 [Chloroflexota bacterium]
MGQIFTVRLGRDHSAPAVRVHAPRQLPAALRTLGLAFGRPTLVLVGGAGRVSEADRERLRPLFTRALAPVVGALEATVVDGGTDAGVMRLMGEAHAESGLRTPVVGVAAEGTIDLAGNGRQRADAARLEPHHTHFVLVPGQTWGDESVWIARVAAAVAGPAPSATLLVNGGTIARQDVAHSVAAGRRVLLVGGSGGTADALAAALARTDTDSESAPLIRSGLLDVISLEDGPAALARALRRGLQGAVPAAQHGEP